MLDTTKKPDPAASALFRSLSLAEMLKKPLARMELRDYDPRLPHTKYVLRAISVIRLLEKFKPQHIVELGSGESSGWFAAYAAKYPGIRITSINQSNWTFEDQPVPSWWDGGYLEKSTQTARTIGGVEFIEARVIPDPPLGWRYDLELPETADFVLLDGPHHNTHEAGMDVPRMLSKGHKPKVICVDGRTTGVDVLCTMTPDYDFHPQMQWCFERRAQRKPGMLSAALAMNQHSVFVRR